MRSVNTKTYYVYIMASPSRVLYIGVTNHIERRVWEHQQHRIPGFSARYNTRELVYCQPFGDIRAAIAYEKQIKGWLRSRKIALIESANPHWKDLSAQWGASAVPSKANKNAPVILGAAIHRTGRKAVIPNEAVDRTAREAVILSEAKDPSEEVKP